MKLIRILIALLFIAIVSQMAQASDKLSVVATTSTLAALVKSVGGDLVDVSSVAPPQFNVHFIEPRPSDVYKVKRCDLFVHSGLDLEAWRDPLINAAGRADLRLGGAHQLDLSTGVSLLEVPSGQPSRAEGDIHSFGNPHYWLSPENALVMARTLASKLMELDPSHADSYKSRASAFDDFLRTRIGTWRAEIPRQSRFELVGYHNEWIYLVHFLGATMEQYLEPKPGIPPTPKHLEQLKAYIKAHNVAGIVQASFYPTEAAESLSKETGVPRLLLCQNVGELPQCSDYVKTIDYNVATIVGALKR